LPFHFLYSQKTDAGRLRDNNEDTIFIEVPEEPELLKKRGALFVLADGLGGMARGEEASRLAVDEMRNFFSHFERLPPASWLHQSIQAVNSRIYNINQNTTRNHWMATTLTCSLFKANKLTVGHVGDSRIYRVRDGELLCLTQDHASGRHTLTRAIGTDLKLAVDIYESELKERDIYIQCSDGLYAYVSEKDLRRTAMGFSPPESCARLVDLANQSGGGDNISVQIIQVKKGLGRLELLGPMC